MNKLERQGAVRYHLREILFDDELMEELFEIMTDAVLAAGPDGPDQVIDVFRQRMSKTGVEFMSKRYEPVMN
jgi:DNA-binding protein YbaB